MWSSWVTLGGSLCDLVGHFVDFGGALGDLGRHLKVTLESGVVKLGDLGGHSG